ncbi:FAD/NAD(P)-binding protein [Kitasatospora sp. NPDC049258]|uniref:FAD/NAD(P)-binding protein n=1 Tax=Kitasatospora sp. NPDC049258 TaxID=3155394 RepID=UPI00342DBE9D
MSTPADLVVCIVGAGPRGLSVLERLCAHERRSPSCASLTVHLVDPAEPGAGRVWRTDQSPQLLMNTVASQITVYTDDSVRIDGPIEPGPSLYEWAGEVAGAGHPADRETLAEARSLGPDRYPTRAFYGRYLRECFRRIVANAPAHLTVLTHRTRAVSLTDTAVSLTDTAVPLTDTAGARGGRAGRDADRPQSVGLADGRRLDGLAAVVLAQGHLPARPTPREREEAALARQHGLRHLGPANPAEVDLDGIGAGERVLLRGLGLNFFDYLALFTLGRGGAFERAGGRLVYRPSGREPRLWAGSRRGVPYHARGENQKGAHGRHLPRLLTPRYLAALRRRGDGGEPAGFGTDLWPLISAEVQSVYYRTLLESRGRAAEGAALGERWLTAPDEPARQRLLDDHRVAPADRWSWQRLADPFPAEGFADRAGLRGWLLDHLDRDIREARAGNVDGPLKAALDVLRDLRNEIRLAVDHGGLRGDSHRDELERWYTPLNAFLSIGPPVARIEQLRALVECGLLELTGPGLEVGIDTGRPAFVARSRLVPDEVRASVLIEARLPEPDLLRTEDPLLRHLLETGQCAAYRIGDHHCGGLAVTRRPYRLLDAQGLAHPRRFAYGVPTEGVHWVTAAGIRPGVDSVTLGDSDAIARAVLSLAPAADTPPGVPARTAVTTSITTSIGAIA